MKTQIILATVLALLSSQASAEVYKCSKDGRAVYQAKPCEPGASDSNLVKVVPPTAEQEAAAKAKLKAIEASNAAYKKRIEKEEEKAFDKRSKLSTIDAMQRDVVEQQRQANALEKQANKPTVGVVPIYTLPGR